MRFDFKAVSEADFTRWVAAAKAKGPVLDDRGYADLARESKAVAPYSYRAVAPGLFDQIVGLRAPAPETPHQGKAGADVSPRTPG
jgi:cytochrome o ubiquinol oxidase subunit 2